MSEVGGRDKGFLNFYYIVCLVCGRVLVSVCPMIAKSTNENSALQVGLVPRSLRIMQLLPSLTFP